MDRGILKAGRIWKKKGGFFIFSKSFFYSKNFRKKILSPKNIFFIFWDRGIFFCCFNALLKTIKWFFPFQSLEKFIFPQKSFWGFFFFFQILFGFHKGFSSSFAWGGLFWGLFFIFGPLQFPLKNSPWIFWGRILIFLIFGPFFGGIVGAIPGAKRGYFCFFKDIFLKRESILWGNGGGGPTGGKRGGEPRSYLTQNLFSNFYGAGEIFGATFNKENPPPQKTCGGLIIQKGNGATRGRLGLNLFFFFSWGRVFSFPPGGARGGQNFFFFLKKI